MLGACDAREEKGTGPVPPRHTGPVFPVRDRFRFSCQRTGLISPPKSPLPRSPPALHGEKAHSLLPKALSAPRNEHSNSQKHVHPDPKAFCRRKSLLGETKDLSPPRSPLLSRQKPLLSGE